MKQLASSYDWSTPYMATYIATYNYTDGKTGFHNFSHISALAKT